MSGAGALVLALAFAWAALAKLRAPGPWSRAVRALVPAPLAPLGVALVPALELALALGLAAGLAPRALGAAALLVLAGFSVVLVLQHRRRLASCGCFGASERPTPTLGLARNAALGVAALVVATGGAPPARGDLTAAAGEVTLALGVVCMALLVDALAGREAVPA